MRRAREHRKTITNAPRDMLSKKDSRHGTPSGELVNRMRKKARPQKKEKRLYKHCDSKTKKKGI